MGIKDIREDFEGIVKTHGIDATLTRTTNTYGNSGEITNTSEKTYSIKMVISGEPRQNRQFQSGISNQGEISAFFFNKYPDSITGNGDLVVKIGDKVKDYNNTLWRVEEISRQPEYEGQEAFRKGKLRKIE